MSQSKANANEANTNQQSSTEYTSIQQIQSVLDQGRDRLTPSHPQRLNDILLKYQSSNRLTGLPTQYSSLTDFMRANPSQSPSEVLENARSVGTLSIENIHQKLFPLGNGMYEEPMESPHGNQDINSNSFTIPQYHKELPATLNPMSSIRSGSSLHGLGDIGSERDEDGIRNRAYVYQKSQQLDNKGWQSTDTDLSARNNDSSMNLYKYLKNSNQNKNLQQKIESENESFVKKALLDQYKYTEDTNRANKTIPSQVTNPQLLKLAKDREQKMFQKESTSKQTSIQASFFESQSKYIALKKVRQDNKNLITNVPFPLCTKKKSQNNLSDQQLTFQKEDCISQIQEHDRKVRLQQIKNWFKSLTLAEKSVAVTTVDKDLVNMFKAMHAKYAQNGNKGKFTANTSSYATDLHRLESVPPYQLLLVKPKHEPQLASNYLRQKQEAEDLLIEQTRIVNVLNQNDGLTLDIDLIENTDFFMNIMKSVDDRFLMKQKEITKVPLPLEGSLLVKSHEQQDSKTVRNSKSQPRQYFFMKDSSRPTFPATTEVQMPEFDNVYSSEQKDESKEPVSLARCILDVIEKAINVQFQDFLGNLAKQQSQSQFFFLTDKDLPCDESLPPILHEDSKLASFWMGLSHDSRREMFDHLSQNIVAQVVKDAKQQKSSKSDNFDRINEEDDETHTSSEDRDQFRDLLNDKSPKSIDINQDDFEQGFQEFGQRRKRQHRKKQQKDESGQGSSSVNTNELNLGGDLLNKSRRSRKQRGIDRKSTSSQSGTNSVASTQNKVQPPQWQQYDYSGSNLQNMYSINEDSPEKSSQQDNYDPESLQPYGNNSLNDQQNKYLTSNSKFYSGWDQTSFDSDEAEVEDGLSHHKNHLFDARNNHQNVAFKHKQALTSIGLKSYNPESSENSQDDLVSDQQNYALSFKFIKKLSSFRSLEHICKESTEDLSSTMQSQMHFCFYQYLTLMKSENTKKELFADMESEQVATVQPEVPKDNQTKKKKNNKKKNKRKNKKELPLDSTVPKEEVKNPETKQPEKEQESFIDENLIFAKLSSQLPDPAPKAQKQIQIDSPQKKTLGFMESPKYSPSSNEDDAAFLEYQHKYLEKVFTTQQFLDEQAQDLENQEIYKLTDSEIQDDQELESKIQEHFYREQFTVTKTLNNLDQLAIYLGEGKEQHELLQKEKENLTKQQTEWNEERTGLLSGAIHYDKYPNESLNNLSDDCDSSDDYQNSRFNDLKSPYVLGDSKRSKIADDRMEQLSYIMNKKSDNDYQPPMRQESDDEIDKQPPYMDRMVEWDQKPQSETKFLDEVLLDMARKQTKDDKSKDLMKNIIGTSRDKQLETMFKGEDSFKLKPPPTLNVQIQKPTVSSDQKMPEQSGSGPVEQELNKKKKKRNKRKNKKKKKTDLGNNIDGSAPEEAKKEGSEKPNNEIVNSANADLAEKKNADFIDDYQIEEVILTEETRDNNLDKSHKVLENPFFVEDSQKPVTQKVAPKLKQEASATNTTQVEKFDQKLSQQQFTNRIEQQAAAIDEDIGNYIGRLTNKLVTETINNQKEVVLDLKEEAAKRGSATVRDKGVTKRKSPSPVKEQQQVLLSQMSKKERKKHKKANNLKAQNKKKLEAEQAKIKEESKVQEEKPLEQVQSQRQVRTASKKSSAGRSTLSDNISVPAFNSGIISMRNQTKVTNYFKADLSDNVKIPKRGTSASSYGKELITHQNLINDLDSLFPTQKPSAKNDRETTGSLPRPSAAVSMDLDLDSPRISQVRATSPLNETQKDDSSMVKSKQGKKAQQVQNNNKQQAVTNQQQAKQKSATKKTDPVSVEKQNVEKQEDEDKWNNFKQHNLKRQTEEPIPEKEPIQPKQQAEKNVPITPAVAPKLTKKQQRAKDRENQLAKELAQQKPAAEPQSKQIEQPEPQKQSQKQEKPVTTEKVPEKAQPQVIAKTQKKNTTVKQPIVATKQPVKPAETKKQQPVKKQAKPSIAPSGYESFESMMKAVYGGQANQSEKKLQTKAAPAPLASQPTLAVIAEPQKSTQNRSKNNSANKQPQQSLVSHQDLPDEVNSKDKQQTKSRGISTFSNFNEQNNSNKELEIDDSKTNEKIETIDTQESTQNQGQNQFMQVNYGKNTSQSSVQVTGMNHQAYQNMQQSVPQQQQFQQVRASQNSSRGYGAMVTPNQGAFFRYQGETQHVEKQIFSNQVTNNSSTQSVDEIQSPSQTSTTNNMSNVTSQTTNNHTVNLNVNIIQPPVQQNQPTMASTPQQNSMSYFPQPQFNQMPYNQQFYQQQQLLMQQYLAQSQNQNSQQFSQNTTRGNNPVLVPQAMLQNVQQPYQNQGYQFGQTPMMMMPQQQMYGNMGYGSQMQFIQPMSITAFVNELPLYTVVNNKGSLLSKIISKKTVESRHLQQQIDVGIGSSVEYKFNKSIGDQITQFSQKIERMIADVEPKRTQVYELIKQKASKTFDGKSLKFDVYGSMATGLAIDTSDLDIAITGAYTSLPNRTDNRKVLIQALQQLHNNLHDLACVKNNQFISSASVPVIKLLIDFDKLEGNFDQKNSQEQQIKLINVDIIFIASEEEKKEAEPDKVPRKKFQSQLCAEFISKQMEEHPFLKPLVIVFKKFIASNGYNSPFQGTLSSYSLVIMILALLKDLKKKHVQFEWAASREDSIMNLGKAFTLFLQFYGDQFKSSDTGINAQFEFKDFYDCTLELEKAQQAQSANLDDHNPALLIVDPIQPMNNVGKQSFDFEKVSNFFNLTLLRMLLRFRELSDMHLVTHDNSSDLNQYKTAIKQKQSEVTHKKKGQDDINDKDDSQNRHAGLATRLQSKKLDELEQEKENLEKSIQQNKTELQLKWSKLLDSILMMDSKSLKLSLNFDEDRELRQVQQLQVYFQTLTNSLPQYGSNSNSNSWSNQTQQSYSPNYGNTQNYHQNNQYGRQNYGFQPQYNQNFYVPNMGQQQQFSQHNQMPVQYQQQAPAFVVNQPIVQQPSESLSASKEASATSQNVDKNQHQV